MLATNRMRSPIGPILVLLGLATVVVLALVLFQTIGVRDELATTREEVARLRTQVEGLERGVPMSELSMRLGELENEVREWVVAFSGDLETDDSPAGGSTDSQRILDRLEQLLDEIEALDRRIDEICENVPVC